MQKVTVFNYAQQYGEEPFTGYMDEDEQMWLDRDQTNRLMTILNTPGTSDNTYNAYWSGGYEVTTEVLDKETGLEDNWFINTSSLKIIDGKVHFNLNANLWWGVPVELLSPSVKGGE